MPASKPQTWQRSVSAYLTLKIFYCVQTPLENTNLIAHVASGQPTLRIARSTGLIKGGAGRSATCRPATKLLHRHCSMPSRHSDLSSPIVRSSRELRPTCVSRAIAVANFQPKRELQRPPRRRDQRPRQRGTARRRRRPWREAWCEVIAREAQILKHIEHKS